MVHTLLVQQKEVTNKIKLTVPKANRNKHTSLHTPFFDT